MSSEDLPTKTAQEKPKRKLKFNLSTTNKGTKIETDLITMIDYAIKLENTRTKLERTI